MILFFLFTYNLLTGQVRDKDTSRPLYLVDVYIQDSKIGTATDEQGNFSLRLPHAGEYTVIFSRIGYREVEKSILLKDSEIYLTVLLEEVPISIKETITATSSYFISEQTEKSGTFSSLDIYNDVGGAAEMFWVIKSLPGANSGSDIAPIYPHGGSPEENIVLLDYTPIIHAFHQENIGGGLFSIFDPVVCRDVAIYLSGFPAQYGNSISSVVDIKSKYRSSRTFTGSLGGSNASLGCHLESSVTHRVSLICSYRQNFTDFLLKKEDFNITPYWRDFTAKLTYHINDSGERIELLGLLTQDAFSVEINNFEYTEKEQSRILSLNMINFIKENGISMLNLAYLNYSPRYYIPGIYEHKPTERSYHLTENFSFMLNEKYNIKSGAVIQKTTFDIYNLFPEDSTRWCDTSVTKIEYRDTVERWTAGIYIQNEISFLERYAFNAGVRCDYQDGSGSLTLDPRFSIGYNLWNNILLNFSTGVYHQFPKIEYYLQGTPGSLEARHYTIGIKKDFGCWLIRGDCYYKDYRHLLRFENNVYTNNGYGYSRGVELFIKFSDFGPLKGWGGYGVCDSKRKEKTLASLQTSEFEVPYNFNLMLSCDLFNEFNFGIKFQNAAGRVYTPIIDVEYDSVRQEFYPLFGAEFSARYPPYQRLDVRLQKKVLVWRLGIIGYFEVTNLLDRQNPVSYFFESSTGEVKPFVLYGRTLILGFVAMF
ncbi:MAG TPA: hypothetical protein ENI34_05020 [candidate division WOR-3 bacterium]|uniref:TonB-dependent receptor-like beta-barrel domain-containing protein n=1 Tax=candidate division WOR-3 bacterium TaxID=2052148 RepID=A0A9C9K083_UNCW3|nr:hypothetical protein [candidate division WOR-3 bacterium]